MTEADLNQYPYGVLPLAPLEEGAKRVFEARALGSYEYNPTQDSATSSSLLSRTDFMQGVRGALRMSIDTVPERFRIRLELGS
jgi:hypothetical protein